MARHEKPTKASQGLCDSYRCGEPRIPGESLCLGHKQERAARHRNCLNCSVPFVAPNYNPRARFCKSGCRIEWQRNRRAVRAGLAPKNTQASVMKIHGDGCRCSKCHAIRTRSAEERAELLNRTAREMGVLVSPLAGVPIEPLTRELFQAKWNKINAAKKAANALETWNP